MEKNIDEAMEEVLNTILDIAYDIDNRLCDRIKAFHLALDHMRRLKIIYGNIDSDKAEKTILQLKPVNKKTSTKKGITERVSEKNEG